MAARDKKPKGGGSDAAAASEPEPQPQPRPKSRLAAPPTPTAKTKDNFKLNMIPVGGAGLRRRGRPSKNSGRRGRGRQPSQPDAKPSLARLVKRKQLTASAALGAKRLLLSKKKKSAEPEAEESAVVKKDVDPEPESRSSSPKTRKSRTSRASSDLMATASQIDAGAKSPYSTRSERSNSPFGQTPAQKSLRNGKQRSLKNALLSETVESEKRKRSRLASETVDPKCEPNSIEEDKKIKRLRSHSRDGSEISKCSDAVESDTSYCENVTDPEIKKETKDLTPDSCAEDAQTKEAKTLSESEAKSSSPANETAPSEKLSDSSLLDCENNNKNSESNESATSVTDSLEITVQNPEKIVEKSLILDNMSKTFNEVSASESSKGIRRSARQRKITVKAKEHEEAILAENSMDVDIKPIIKLAREEEEDVSKLAEGIEANDSVALNDCVSERGSLSPKLVKDLNRVENSLDSEPGNIKVEPSVEKPASRSSVDNKNGEEMSNDDVSPKLHDNEPGIVDGLDESSKENIQSSFTAKSMQVQDFGKLIDRLKNFEEQDERKRQEKKLKFNNTEKRAVMVTNDVVLIPKSTMDGKVPKDKQNSLTIEKIKDKEKLNCFDGSVSVVNKKDDIHASYDLPKSVTLIKRTSSSSSRKHSTGSSSRDEDSVTMIDKSLGKEVTFDIRKSIDKGILSIETSKSPQPTALSCSSSLQVVASSSRLPKSTGLKETPAVIHIVPINSEISTENQKPNVSSVDVTSKGDSVVTYNAIAAVPVPKLIKINQTNDAVPVIQFMETPEKQKQKEEVLGKLGLLTHKAANEAKLEKQKQKLLYKTNETYTGTLKTIIKVNRNSPDKKKNRSSLKMTFHKNKNRGNKMPSDTYSGDSDSDDGPSYTINKKEFGVSSGVGSGSSDSHLTSGGHRKTHYSNRYNNHELGPQDSFGESLIDTSANKEATTSLVIPEKASSFAIHPDRICQDQCYYCGGKFGLFDTPCHIAQIKSVDRQKKILNNEEKLTVDSCLCDACYRHVDRRANCASYRKRVGPGPSTTAPTIIGVGDVCYVNSCNRPAPQTLRRKWLVKMRKSVNKVVQLDLDYPGLHTIPLCDDHYQAVLELMVCGLCKRKLSKNHVRYINQEYRALNPLLKDQGLPVVFEDKPVVCKLCRYYCTLLLRPSKSLMNKQSFLKTHRKRLLQAHNLRVSEESDTDYTDDPSSLPDGNHDQIDGSREKKKSKNGKSKSKKDENNILNQTSHKNKGNENWKSINNEKSNPNITSNSKDCVEDIESLISTNKILIPNLISSKTSELDAAGIPVIEITDKSLPISGILQRNTVTSLNQKSKNILKVHNAPAINKHSHSQKKLSKNLRRIQKLGQIITQKGEFEETLNSKLPNREEFTIEPMNDDGIGHSILRNIVLNDECTIETIPAKSVKRTVDINSMKSKWQNTESFMRVQKNLSAPSKNFISDQNKKRVFNPNDSQFSNPVRRLETNPSISVRELFPGEEEMNLQCSIEFGNVKTTTPEGWEKCSSIIQYDNSTKQLWQHLQQPYGNQSSFLRHLILLEKYFRNGDLVLSPNANCNAVTYSESVQNRLRAFDNVLINGSMPVVTILQKPQQIPATITQIETIEHGKKIDNVVEFRKPIVNIGSGKSLLKSNQITNVGNNKKVNKSDSSLLVSNQIKLPKNSVLSQANDQTVNGSNSLKDMASSLTHLEKLGNQLAPIQVSAIPRPPTPRPDLPKMNEIKLLSSPFAMGDVKTSTPKSDSGVHKIKSSSLPPELIAINPQTILPRKSMEKVLKNIQQLEKNSSSSMQTQTVSNTTPPVINAQQPKSSKTTVTNAKESKKGKTVIKQWRPTLIPITDENKSRSNRNVLHQTADGRKLPSLVKVTQAGKPYHITIDDYNRMCIMRREKMQKERENQAQVPDQSKISSAKPMDVSTDSSAASTIVNKSRSPVSVESENSSVTVQSSNGKTVESSVLSVPNIPIGKVEDDKKVTVLSEVENSSLLMNVALKNITIAPINTTSSAKTLNNPQSLLITSAKSVVQVPQVVTQLSPSVSVTAETVISSETNTATALIPKVVPITSQAIIMPKIPKSLTVIPQTVTNAPNKVTSPVLAPTQNSPSLSVLPIPVTTTVALSPPEP